MKNTFELPDYLLYAREGDVVVLDGQKCIVVKRTNFNMSVRPYTFFEQIWDKLKEWTA